MPAALPALGLMALGGTAGAAGSSGAPSSPAPLTGSVTCTLTGKMAFTPALRLSGATGDRVTFTGTLSKCTGTVAPSTVTVRGGRITLATTSPASSHVCGPILTDGAALPNLAGTVAWTGPGTAAAAHSALTVSGGNFFEDTNDNALVWTVPSGGATVASGGSFAGPVSWPSSNAAPGATRALGECRSGLSRLTLGTVRSPISVTFGTVGV